MEQTIHTDNRGETALLSIGNKPFNAIFTRAGMLRGGHSHPYVQYCTVLSGEFKITLFQNNQDIVLQKKANDFFAIPAGVPHLFEATTDAVFVEWMDQPYEATNFEPYRALVIARMQQA